MNICPECAREWPTTAKFCPFDGTKLNVPETKEEALEAHETSARTPSPSTVNRTDKLDENPKTATTEVVSRVPTPPKKAKQESIKLSSEAPTVEELPSVAPTIEELPSVAPTEKDLPSVAPTEKDLPSVASSEAPQEEVLGEDDLDRFSETSWFMAASTIEKLDTEEEHLSVDEEKYRPDSALKDEIRKKFSLRESGDGE